MPEGCDPPRPCPSSPPLAFRRASVESPKTADAEGVVERDAAVGRAESGARHHHGFRHLLELRIDERQLTSQAMRDPDGAQAHGYPGRCPLFQRDRRRCRPLLGIDPGRRPVLHVPDPDRAGAACDRTGLDPDRDLRDDLVRPRIDHPHVIGLDATETARARPQEEHCREGNRKGNDDRSGERGPATPDRRSDRLFRRFLEICTPSNRWKPLLQPFRRRLVETDGPIEILQPLLPEVAQEDVQVLLLVLEQRLRRLRDEDLSAVARRTDPCGTVHGEPGVAAVVRDRLTGVQAHSNVDLDALGPRV